MWPTEWIKCSTFCFLAFEGKRWLCSVEYFSTDEASWESFMWRGEMEWLREWWEGRMEMEKGDCSWWWTLAELCLGELHQAKADLSHLPSTSITNHVIDDLSFQNLCSISRVVASYLQTMYCRFPIKQWYSSVHVDLIDAFCIKIISFF